MRRTNSRQAGSLSWSIMIVIMIIGVLAAIVCRPSGATPSGEDVGGDSCTQPLQEHGYRTVTIRRRSGPAPAIGAARLPLMRPNTWIRSDPVTKGVIKASLRGFNDLRIDFTTTLRRLITGKFTDAGRARQKLGCGSPSPTDFGARPCPAVPPGSSKVDESQRLTSRARRGHHPLRDVGPASERPRRGPFPFHPNSWRRKQWRCPRADACQS